MEPILYTTKHYKLMKKQLLNKMTSSDYSYEDKIYNKLGDICIKLKEYDQAKQYYKHSINNNSYNGDTFFKLGYLFNYHIIDVEKAKMMYNKCLEIDPCHQQCIFHLALWFKKVKCDINKAKQLMKKCYQIQDDKACVNYHLAKILIQENEQNYNDINHKNNILFLLNKAIEIKPSIAKYHFELGLFLESIGNYNQANHSYYTALTLIRFKDALILYKYSIFLIKYMNNKEKSLKYMKKACELNIKYRHDLILLSSTSNSIYNEPNHVIKLIIYDFTTVIQYWCLSKTINNSMKKLKTLKKKELISIFGGNDRIKTLKNHFDRVLSLNDRVNAKIATISFELFEIMKISLERIGLIKYFEFIIGTDTSLFIEKKCNIMYDIVKMKDVYRIFNKNEILYISANKENIKDVKDECLTYFINIDKIKPLFGPSLNDLQNVEYIINDPDYILQLNEIQNAESKMSSSLKEINEHLFLSMVKEIIQNKNSKHLDELITIKIVKEKQNIFDNYYKFYEFGKLFFHVVNASKNYEWWIVCNMMNEIFYFEQNDTELLRKYAKGLSGLRHIDAADSMYNKALQLDSQNYWTILGYGHHLLSINKYKKAQNVFFKAIRTSNYIIQDRNLYTAIAETMECLNETKKAEMYYKLAITFKKYILNHARNIKNYAHEKAHHCYGLFLMNQERCEEAEFQFEICLKNSPNKLKIYHRLRDVSDILNNAEKYNYYSNKISNIHKDSNQTNLNDYYEKIIQHHLNK